MIDSPLIPHRGGFIDGKWVQGAGKPVTVTNTATGEQLASMPGMGPDDARAAADAAARALDRTVTLETRRAWLKKITQALEDNERELGRIITLEHGKPLAEARKEVAYAAGFFRFCGENIEALGPETLDSQPRDCKWTIHRRPTGVAALLVPWNFPIAMIAKKLSAALAAGCPSITKPSGKTPLTMIALFHLLDTEVDLPAGMANLVIGPAGEISDALCEHPAVRIVSFTGSTEVGKMLAEKCAPGVKRLALELGGNAPYIVFEDADLERAADQLIGNKFRGSGQTCVCANRILVHEDIADEFAGLVATRVAALKVGNGLDDDTDIGPLIDRDGWDKVARHVDDAVNRGAKRVVGETPDPPSTDAGCFYPPTVLTGVTRDMVCFQEETFGPLVPIIPFANDEDALETANDTEHGLAAYIFTADPKRAERIIAGLRFGHVGHNTGSGPTPEAPFGGVKRSGYGREGGIDGMLELTEAQTVPFMP